MKIQFNGTADKNDLEIIEKGAKFAGLSKAAFMIYSALKEARSILVTNNDKSLKDGSSTKKN